MTVFECPGYDSKPTEGETTVLELWKIGINSSLPLLLGPLRNGWIVPVLSMDQIEFDNHSLYLKPFNCVQTNEDWFILKWNYQQTLH